MFIYLFKSRLGESGSLQLPRVVFDYEYLHEFDAKIGQKPNGSKGSVRDHEEPIRIVPHKINFKYFDENLQYYVKPGTSTGFFNF